MQFAASNTAALPILLHGKDVLALPSLPEVENFTSHEPGRPPPPNLREDELVDLVRYLADLVSKSTVLAVHHDSSMSELTRATPSSLVSNAWTSSLSTLATGMSFLAPRPLSLSLAAGPSVAEIRDPNPSKNLKAGFAALRQQEKAALAEPARERATALPARAASPRASDEDGKIRDASGGWSLRNVSWGKLGFGGSSAVSTAKTAAELACTVEETLAPGDASTALDDAARSPDGRSESVAEPEVSKIESRSIETENLRVELAPTVDTEDLAAAIGLTPEVEGDRQLQLVKVQDEPTRAGQAASDLEAEGGEADEPEEARQKVLDIYVGGAEPSRCQLRRYTVRLRCSFWCLPSSYMLGSP